MFGTRILRRLPNSSPSRSEIGTATAAASSVAVMIQGAFDAYVLSVREGSLERALDRAGSIARKLALIPAGKTRFREVREHSVSTLGRILDGWSETEITVFADLMRKFNVSIEENRETQGG